MEVSEKEVVDTLEHIVTGSVCSKVSKYYTLNALMKLSTRFKTDADRIQKVRLQKRTAIAASQFYLYY